MIQHGHLQHFSGLLQLLGELDIGLAGIQVAPASSDTRLFITLDQVEVDSIAIQMAR